MTCPKPGHSQMTCPKPGHSQMRCPKPAQSQLTCPYCEASQSWSTWTIGHVPIPYLVDRLLAASGEIAVSVVA